MKEMEKSIVPMLFNIARNDNMKKSKRWDLSG